MSEFEFNKIDIEMRDRAKLFNELPLVEEAIRRSKQLISYSPEKVEEIFRKNLMRENK